MRWLGLVSVSLVLLACDADGNDVRSFSTAHVQPTQRNDATSSTATPDTSTTADDDTQTPTTALPDTTVAADSTPTTSLPDATSPADTTAAQDTTSPQDTTVVQDTTTSNPETVQEDPGPFDINENWIGGACGNDSECSFTNGDCLTDASGWPNGMCTQPCTLTCPDQTGAAVTFCIDGSDFDESGGLCVQKCDFGKSPTGCREGYHCVTESRFNQPATISYVCVPGEGELAVTGCIQELVARGISFELASNPMDTPANAQPGDVCDVLDPVRINPIIDGVELRAGDFDGSLNKLFVQCPVALAIYDTVQLAKQWDIVKIVHYGTYNCRYIAGTTSLSEHAFANAIDLAGFETADGDQWTVLGDWDHCDTTPEAKGGEFLYWLGVQMHARGVWNIILDPEYNAAHQDHYHVDLTPNADYFATCQ